MKLVVCGGRYEILTPGRQKWLWRFIVENDCREVVTGGCRGIDREVHAWADTNLLNAKVFEADFANLGRSAGPRRNAEMAAYGDLLVAFPGGRGTADMVRKMTAAGKRVARAE